MRRPFTTRVIRRNFVPIEKAIVVSICFMHDFVRNAVLPTVGDRFFFGHDPIVVSIAFLEIGQASGIIASPFVGRHLAIVIRITRVENFVY